MKIKTIAITTIFLLSINACSENIPTVDELVKNKPLYERIKLECKDIGSFEKQIKNKKCFNYHKAVDKRIAKNNHIPKDIFSKPEKKETKENHSLRMVEMMDKMDKTNLTKEQLNRMAKIYSSNKSTLEKARLMEVIKQENNK
ncbi:hypothetical protein MNBD_GAMMA01-1602 [hydrothermal vent metagenome]|uniref:Uncharacterized protein n=1 Tax=hydrothermal vent metagenome TaxID=652676 RepID=A0A3B0WFQ0_9ZZZZ